MNNSDNRRWCGTGKDTTMSVSLKISFIDLLDAMSNAKTLPDAKQTATRQAPLVPNIQEVCQNDSSDRSSCFSSLCAAMLFYYFLKAKVLTDVSLNYVSFGTMHHVGKRISNKFKVV